MKTGTSSHVVPRLRMVPREWLSMTQQQEEQRVALLLAALGVVYGDIGTSPLYALRESLHAGALELTRASILGVLSLVVWTLLIVVTVKYVGFVMRADHKGEGGI